MKYMCKVPSTGPEIESSLKSSWKKKKARGENTASDMADLGFIYQFIQQIFNSSTYFVSRDVWHARQEHVFLGTESADTQKHMQRRINERSPQCGKCHHKTNGSVNGGTALYRVVREGFLEEGRFKLRMKNDKSQPCEDWRERVSGTRKGTSQRLRPKKPQCGWDERPVPE